MTEIYKLIVFLHL